MPEPSLPVGYRPLLVAHRGAPRIARENTLASIAAAARTGADWIELDVRLTADGEPVIKHDRTLHRLWGHPVAVDAVTLEHLRSLTESTNGRSVTGIPVLSDAIEYAVRRGGRVLLDIGGADEARACIRSETVRGRIGSVGFTGDPDALRLVREAFPAAEIFMSWEDDVFPDAELLDAVRPQFLNQLADHCSARFVAEARERNLRVSAYVVDDVDTADALVRAGVEAIITNDIALFAEAFSVTTR
jgi:glycerophosphoryl diester phosphodiesterase